MKLALAKFVLVATFRGVFVDAFASALGRSVNA